jgi:hypothetical protein
MRTSAFRRITAIIVFVAAFFASISMVPQANAANGSETYGPPVKKSGVIVKCSTTITDSLWDQGYRYVFYKTDGDYVATINGQSPTNDFWGGFKADESTKNVLCEMELTQKCLDDCAEFLVSFYVGKYPTWEESKDTAVAIGSKTVTPPCSNAVPTSSKEAQPQSLSQTGSSIQPAAMAIAMFALGGGLIFLARRKAR